MEGGVEELSARDKMGTKLGWERDVRERDWGGLDGRHWLQYVCERLMGGLVFKETGRGICTSRHFSAHL